MILHPTYYKRLPTTEWELWTKGDISHEILVVNIFGGLFFKGIGNVYSFAFDRAPRISQFTPQWEADKGWTVTFLDALLNKTVNEVSLEYYRNNQVPQNNGDCYYLRQ